MTDRVGQHLGNYRLLQLLGAGGFAEVYLGEQVHLGTQAAIKVLATRLSAEEVERFREEARTIARLNHPHITRVLDFGLEGGVPYLVMEYAAGGTLRQRHPKGTRVPHHAILSYVQQVAAALQYAHDRKLIHRDIKPENMLIAGSGEILLSDFGIAVAAQSSRYQSTQDTAGTIAYMAPEQIQGHPRPASDQYSLGVVVYEWLVGERPFTGSMSEVVAKHLALAPPPLREQLPAISPMLEQVVLRALEKDPKARFASVSAFASALEEASQKPFPATSSLVLPAIPPLAAAETEQATPGEPTLPDTPPIASAIPPAETQDEPPMPPLVARDTTLRVPAPVAAPASVTRTRVAERSIHRPTRPARKLRWHPLLLTLGLLLIVVPAGLLVTSWLPSRGAGLNSSATQTTLSQRAAQTAAAQNATSTATGKIIATAQAQGATATAQALAPYHAQVPGPCNDSTGQWSSDYTDNRGVVCMNDRLRLVGITASDGSAGADVLFTRHPFPANYTMSVQISNFQGKSSPHVIFTIVLSTGAETTDVAFFLTPFAQGSWFIVVSGPTTSLTLAQGGFSQNVATTTVGCILKGARVSLLLNGRQVTSYTSPSPELTSGIDLAVETDRSSAQADFQNFSFVPTL